MQCQLSLFNGGYLKAGGTKRVHIALLFSVASWMGWKNLLKRGGWQWAQNKCTMLTVFQIPLIAFLTIPRKQPLLLSCTSTNNTLTKPPNPMHCSLTKPPRLSKRSHWRTERSPFTSALFPCQKEEKSRGRRGCQEGHCQGIHNISLLRRGGNLRAALGSRRKAKGEISKVSKEPDTPGKCMGLWKWHSDKYIPVCLRMRTAAQQCPGRGDVHTAHGWAWIEQWNLHYIFYIV